METKMIATNISHGTVHFTDRMISISDAEWTRHPLFEGVYLKNMIKGEDSGGLFSSHLVKIDPDCCLADHCHEAQMELHEVIEGDGQCRLIEKKFDYHPGKMALIPKGENHRVQAGKNGLTLMAKFFPALL